MQAYLFYNSRDANQFHTLLIWSGLPGLLLIGAWIRSLHWRLSAQPACVQALLPGTFTALAVYQLVDAIWGFAPSFALLCLLFGMVCPLHKGWALAGISLATFSGFAGVVGVGAVAGHV